MNKTKLSQKYKRVGEKQSNFASPPCAHFFSRMKEVVKIIERMETIYRNRVDHLKRIDT